MPEQRVSVSLLPTGNLQHAKITIDGFICSYLYKFFSFLDTQNKKSYSHFLITYVYAFSFLYTVPIVHARLPASQIKVAFR